MKGKTIYLNKEREVTLTPYIVSKKNAPTIFIAPGGAYTECDVSEGEPVAKAYNTYGFNAFILQYSVGKHFKWPYPLDDYEQAIQHIVDNADEYNIDMDHIIAVGLSAGGHLVAMAASVAKKKPFATIICYGLTIKENLEYLDLVIPDANEAVNQNTCPCFIVSSRNDWIVPINNTTRFIEALNKNYIDYETHIYGYAMHGFSIGKAVGADGPLFCSRVGNWVNDSVEWISELISGKYVSIRENAEYNDKFGNILSINNSCKLIFSNIEVEEMIKMDYQEIYNIYSEVKKKIGKIIDDITLKNLLQFMKVDDNIFFKLKEALSKFPVKAPQIK